jgi:hypothetical protein
MTTRQNPAARLPGAAMAVIVATLAAVAAGPSTAQTGPSAAGDCGACGKIESIRKSTAKAQWTPLGTGVGVGGAPSVGDQPSAVTTFRIGPGLSNQGMVVLGAAGGAAYKTTPGSYEQPRWDVTVKMDGGGVRVVSMSFEPYVREGDHVRIAGSNVELLDE